MAIGTTVDLSTTRDEIITEALELLTVIEAGQAPSSDDVTSLSRTLNMMLKAWQADGVTMTTKKLAYLFPDDGKTSYSLLSTGDKYAYSYVRTTVNGALASGVSSVVLDSVTDIANTYNIGLYQADGSMHWTTVNGAPSGYTVDLTDATTDEIEDGAVVYVFPAKADRPMDVVDAWIRNSDQHDTPIEVVSLREYMDQSSKTSEGQINLVTYDAQVSAPILRVYPSPEDLRDIVVLMVKRSVYDFDAADENPDFPQEAYLPIAYNLAVLAAPKFGNPPVISLIAPLADKYYTQYANYAGKPDGPVRFEIDTDY